jgi:hypothetical protein
LVAGASTDTEWCVLGILDDLTDLVDALDVRDDDGGSTGVENAAELPV